MKITAFASLFGVMILLIAPAQAALILQKTGSLADLTVDSDYQQNVVYLGIQALLAPSGAPSFSTPPIFNGSEPANPWVIHGDPVRYTISLTTSIPLSDTSLTTYQAYWYDEYAKVDDQWTNIGGNDNSGGLSDPPSCNFGFPACSFSESQIGNVITLSVVAENYASWSVETGSPYPAWVKYSSWLNGVEVRGQTNYSVYNAPYTYTLSVFVTALPEPSTWAMLLLGFFALGTALRSKRNSDVMGRF